MKLVAHTANLNVRNPVVHWKPNQLKFCIKIVLFSFDGLTVVN